MKYEHTQTGYLFLFILLVLTIFYGFMYILVEYNLMVLSIIFPFLLLIASFSTLKVSIDEKHIKLKFGYGIFRKKFTLKEIISVRTVRNKWYYGWGIRFILPNTWIFNVSGLDAVEIKLKNNKTFRIGTDEPKKLEQTLLESIK